MHVKRKALGRGLDALLPAAPLEAEVATAGRTVTEIEISSIIPNPYQPRVSVSNESLAELVESIKAQGVIQPILVRRVDRRYQLVAGERRWRAAKLAEKTHVPAIIVELAEEEMLEWALLENIQRADLNPIEEARAYQTLLNQFGLSQEEMATRVGKKRSSVANSLRLLKLPEEIQQDLLNGSLTAGHGRAILSLSQSAQQMRLREEILRRDLSVRQAERLASQLAKLRPASKQKSGRGSLEAPELADLADRLSERLSTKVAVRPKSMTAGTIEIHYRNLDDLDRILDILDSKNSQDTNRPV